MKKLTLCLLLLFSVFALVACSGNEPVSPPEPTPAVVETPAPEEIVEPEAELEMPLPLEPSRVPAPTPEPAPIAPSELVTDLSDLANHWIELDGQRLMAGTTLDEFLAIPGVQTFVSDVEVSYLGSRAGASVSLERQNDAGRWQFAVTVGVVNDGVAPILFPDARVRSISMRADDVALWNDVVFINGICFSATTQDDLIAMFGEPTSTREGGRLVTMDYQVSGVGYSFTVNTETGLLFEIRMDGPHAGRF